MAPCPAVVRANLHIPWPIPVSGAIPYWPKTPWRLVQAEPSKRPPSRRWKHLSSTATAGPFPVIGFCQCRAAPAQIETSRASQFWSAPWGCVHSRAQFRFAMGGPDDARCAQLRRGQSLCECSYIASESSQVRPQPLPLSIAALLFSANLSASLKSRLDCPNQQCCRLP